LSSRLRSYAAIGAATLVPLAVYAASLRGDVSFWDTGDLQTVPYILGIPYPTGFPGYVLIGWVWSHVLAVGSVAWRMNLLAAVATAVAAGALTASLLVLGVVELVAVAAALAFAFATVVWERATYVDAHRIAFAAAVIALAFALRWLRDGRWSDARWAGLAAAAALAIDDAAILMLPALAVVVLGRRPPVREAARLLATCAVVVAAVYAYLPIRSAVVSAARTDPTLALGLAPGRPFWDDHHAASIDGFVRLVAGTEFAPHAAAAQMVSARAILRIAQDVGPPMRRDFGDIGVGLALIGAFVCSRREPRVLAGLVTFGVVPLLFVVSYGAEADAARYYAPAYLAFAACAAYGASALATALRPPLLPAFAGAGVLAVAALLVADVTGNAPLFAQRTVPDASPFVDRVVTTTPANAIVVASWVYAPPLAYRAYVEHGFGDRIVVTAWPQEVAGHIDAWMLRRPVIVVGPVTGTLAARTELLDDGDPALRRVVR
jgi:hypothetical protein